MCETCQYKGIFTTVEMWTRARISIKRDKKKDCLFSQRRIMKSRIKCMREIISEFWQAVSHSFHSHHTYRSRNMSQRPHTQCTVEVLARRRNSGRSSNCSTLKRFLPPAFPCATASLRLHSIRTQAFTVPPTLRAQRAPTIVEFS